MLIDTHCHIHESSYPLDRDTVLTRAHEANVEMMICVGTTLKSSREAVEFARGHTDVYATLGVHPHEASGGQWQQLGQLLEMAHTKSQRPGLHGSKDTVIQSTATYGVDLQIAEARPLRSAADVATERNKVVAIGEIGLDYFYTHSPRETQIMALEAQLQLAVDHNLPVSFHVREAFADFWPVLDNFPGIRGVLHSFTDTVETLETALGRGLYIGVNGIATFARDKQAMYTAVPLERMLLETDAPFLTPVPYRGTVNEPALVSYVAEFVARERQITTEQVAAITTTSARELFAV